jgi:hypothetical protein
MRPRYVLSGSVVVAVCVNCMAAAPVEPISQRGVATRSAAIATRPVVIGTSGVQPAIAVDQAEHDFGQLAAGGVKLQHTFTPTNKVR